MGLKFGAKCYFKLSIEQHLKVAELNDKQISKLTKWFQWIDIQLIAGDL